MAFLTENELKAYPLPITNAQWAKINELDDDQIDVVLNYASQHVEDYLERKIEEAEYIERIQGRNRGTLMLNNYPVISIDGVSSTDVYGYTRTYDANAFLMDGDAGIIEWLDKYRNTFVKGYLWTIEYTAGYAAVPGPIKHATALVAVQMLQPLFRGGTNFTQVDLLDESNETIVDMLERYRRQRIG